MMVQICSEPMGQLLIYDNGSAKHLLSFSNKGFSWKCNHWEHQNYDRFITDSNKVSLTFNFKF